MIRPARPEEIVPVCDRIAAINPWKLLGIIGSELVHGLDIDPLRKMYVYEDEEAGGEVCGAIIIRERHAAELLFFRGFGAAMAADAGLDYPCDWSAIPDAGYIGSLAVLGETGQGTGQRLIDAAHARFAESGHDRVYLMVSHFNGGARRFYERNGYHAIAYVDDCIRPGNREHLMKRML